MPMGSLRSRTHLAKWLFALALLPTACLQGAPLENKKEIQEALGCDIDRLFLSCDGATCHEGTPAEPPLGGVDFFGPGTPDNLVGMAAQYPPDVQTFYPTYGLCPVDNPELIIDPINPDESLFLKKLNKTQTCGTVMPSDGELNAQEIACFREWVLGVIAATTGVPGSGGTQ